MRRLVSIAALTLAFSTIGAAFASTTALAPEVDQAGATFTLAVQATPTQLTCLGEDGVNYQTTSGSWKGPETDISPLPLDVSLNGTLTMSATLTSNLTNGRGYVTGKVSLKSGGIKTMSGSFTAISQVINANLDLQIRGQFIGTMFSAAGATGDFTVANFEATVDGATFGISGQIGGGPVVPDLSAQTTKLTC